MNLKAISHGFASVILTLIGATFQINAVAQEMYLTHPSSCVAPFLFQAERMRWHEHFLMNPDVGQRTWVVCPIDMYVDDMGVPESGNWAIQVYLQKMPTAVMVQPKCFFTVHSVLNQKWGNYINGDAITFTSPLPLQTSDGITVAQGVASVGDIIELLGSEAAAAPFHLAVYCRLDPGWGLNGVELVELEPEPM